VQATRPLEYPEADFLYFKALATEESAPIRDWLASHQKHRFAREAAERLLQLLVDNEASKEEITEAIAGWDATRLPDLKATEALKGIKMLLGQGQPELALEMGAFGIKGGRADRYPEAVHELHREMGEILLNRGENQRAWEHLLSAAFGLPEDGRISYLLGTFYEREGRLERALSRYSQALLRPESGPAAVNAIENLRALMPEITIDTIDAMLQGRTFNFSPATTYVPPKQGKPPTRTVLAELFTNPELGRFQGGQWISLAVGGAMALEGLMAFYPQDRLLALTWHIDVPAPSAVMIDSGLRRAREERLGPNILLIKGTGRGPGAGRDRDAEAMFEQNRALVDTALEDPSNLTMVIEAKIDADVLKGTLTVTGPADAQDRVQLVLAERGVLCPGKGLVVVHRMLARAEILSGHDGIPFRPRDGKMVIPFEVKLKAITAANESFLDRYQEQGKGMPARISSKIDPKQVSLVASVRDQSSGEVWHAHRHDVTNFGSHQ
jgi:hypothetical protein